jgi:hypothetical protein
MYTNNNQCNAIPQGVIDLHTVGEGQLLTLLQGYNATLEDVELSELVFPLEREPGLQAVKDGELILLKEQLKRHHQLKPITVRRSEDRFEVIEGEIQILALQELGYTNATAIIIECDDDDKVAEIRQALQSIQSEIPIPYSVRLAAFNEVKEAVKEGRNKLKAEGAQDIPTTNAMVAEVMDVNEQYVKRMNQIANNTDRDAIAARLDRGESMNAVTTEANDNGRIKGVQAPQTPRTCEIPAAHDIAAICPNCPNYLRFMEKLQDMRSNTVNAN